MWMNTTWRRVHHLALKMIKAKFRNGSMVSLRFFCAYAGLQKGLPFYEGIRLKEAERLFQGARFRDIRSHDTSLFGPYPYGAAGGDRGDRPGFFIVQARK
jgi:hypothetical protein